MLKNNLIVIREFKREKGILACIKPREEIVFTMDLIDEIRLLQDNLVESYILNPWKGYLYIIWYIEESASIGYQPNNSTHDYILSMNKVNSDIDEYISKFHDVLFLQATGLGLPIINCSFLNFYLTGLEKEFFLNSQVCFIRSKINKTNANILDLIEKLTFKDKIYEPNNYFLYSSFNIVEFKKILSNLNPKRIRDKDINFYRYNFDLSRDNLLKKLGIL